MLLKIVVTLALTVFIINVSSLTPMADSSKVSVVGGVGQLREKDNKAQDVVDTIMPQLTEKAGKHYKSVEVLSYKTQVVAGKNYFVKAKATTPDNQIEFLHLRIYQSLNGELILHQVQFNKSEKDELGYFQ